jgi:tetratricopeptide (TPR) repeat protein
LQFEFARDYASGIPNLRRAIALDPSYPDARLYLGIALGDEGRFSESIAELRKALELDPLSPPILAALGRVLLMAGELDESLRQSDAAIAVNPSFSTPHTARGTALLAQGRVAEGLATFRVALSASIPRSVDSAFLAYGLAVRGDRNEAQRIVRALDAEQRHEFNIRAIVGLVYLGLGERAEALTWFERHVQGNGGRTFLRFPITEPVRNDPRFIRVMEALAVKRPEAPR